MTKAELVKGLTYLGVAINKEYTQQECEVFYDFLKDYEYEVFIKAVKNRILKSQYLPKVNELIAECENCQNEKKMAVVEYMKAVGYFKSIVEYEKTLHFLKTNIIPGWLEKDLNKYQQIMNREKLEFKQGTQI